MTAPVRRLDYPAPSSISLAPELTRLQLALAPGVAAESRGSGPIGFAGRVESSELLRDALLTALAVRDSDLRYRGSDRSAYLAYLMKQGKKASKQIWEAQKTFLEHAHAESAPRPRGLDPWLSIDPDELSLEVFSRDESAYARLSFANSMFDRRGAAHGTANVNLNPAFVEQLERLPADRALEFSASTELTGEPSPREVEVPDAWLRGFLQVQSAATLPNVVLGMLPIDLYNVLFTLRVRRAKQAPRALRFELVPGEKPRVVVEPWETTLTCHGPSFDGTKPRIVRIFGRQRLRLLERALPHAKSLRVHLLGPGLPSFWVIEMGAARLTLALTSWSESSWASSASFDALMPVGEAPRSLQVAIDTLRQVGPLPLGELAQAIGVTPVVARSLLQRACLRGEVLFDLATGQYRPRALERTPIDESRTRYASEREARAHRLLGDGGARSGRVEIQKIHEITGEGREISATVDDLAARRHYTPRFTLDLESQVKKADCNCSQFQRSGLREGPCEHMLAAYITFLRNQAEAERARNTVEGRKLLRAETRSLVRRAENGARTSFRISLDERRLSIEEQRAEPDQPFGESRFQRLWFDTDAEAKAAYFARLDELGEKGFIDLQMAG